MIVNIGRGRKSHAYVFLELESYGIMVSGADTRMKFARAAWSSERFPGPGHAYVKLEGRL